MSAITGIFQFNKEPISFEHSNGLMKGLQKYPADNIHIWQKDQIFLGCHAQWITPESISEQLPYYDYERQLAITADAIIDNRDELLGKLQIRNDKKKAMSDSELILLAYEKWGEEVPKYLIGDFAFMIWDEKKRKLFGARDFSGSRTLYFYRNQQRFAFCTIIQPLFSLPYVEKKLNEQWLAEFLAIPGMVETVDTSSTVFKDIEQLPPSHAISVLDGRVTLSRYCTLVAGKQLKLKSNEEYEEAFREVFQSAVTARLRTYSNVGAHLSGGLDSGAVVSFAARALRKENKQLHTFSYVPEDKFIDWMPKYLIADERPFIQSTVQYVGNIKDHYLSFQGKDPLSEVDDWLEMLEMPYKFFENSFWMRGIYERAQQEGIRLLLNGARGNFTISWGSALEHYTNLLKRLKWVRLYHEIQQYSENLGAKKSRIISVIGKKAFPFINRMSPLKGQEPFPMLINSSFAKRTNVFAKLQEYGMDPTRGSSTETAYEVRRRQFEQLFFWNKNGTLGTKLSLRYSLWDRDPTNDIRVVRFCLSVPEEQYVQNGFDRALIRRSTQNLLPDKVRLNQHVRGVQGADVIHRMIPFWNTFLEELHQLSTDPLVSELLNVQVIKDAISKLGEHPQPEYVFNMEFKILTRSLIVYRFIKNFT